MDAARAPRHPGRAPRQLPAYAGNVAQLLAPGARYLSVCSSEHDPQFGGRGKYRLTRVGTCLYFSSEQEIADLFSPYFTLLDLKTIKIGGEPGAHLAVYAFMERRAM